MMYAWMAVASHGFAYPSITALMSGMVDPGEQGALQGTLSSLQGLSAVIGPLVMTQLFAACTAPSAPVQFPGIAFLCAALLAATSFLVAQRVLPARPLPPEASPSNQG